MFIPTTKNELFELKWEQLDVIIISGDAYIDSYYDGASIIGHLLIDNGYKTGMISQPDINSDKDITRLGEPALFWGITSGSVDSMVSNYTSAKKRRNKDDLTPGGINNKRPDRALIVYSNLVRRYFKNTVPIVLGGIEASLRRIAHFDYWSNNIRRSILFDSKANLLVYGMGEKPILEIADCIKKKKNYNNINGTCYISKEKKLNYIELPSYEEVKSDNNKLIQMFNLFHDNMNYYNSKGLIQLHDKRYLVHNPPQAPLTESEIDYIYSLSYERKTHPYYLKQGKVKAIDTIQFSITTHRGCYGDCNFCAIAIHQGKRIISRSETSIINEAKSFINHPDFKGIINDLGGPTANMYSIECTKKIEKGPCKNKRCITPVICENLKISHEKQISLLKKIREINGIKRIFISSGLRYDLIVNDKKFGEKYLYILLEYHTSGQLKIAPEHSENSVLKIMGKPLNYVFMNFIKLFKKINSKISNKKYLTYYFIAAHPGCTMEHMLNLKNFVKNKLQITPRQIQIFTPTPSTYSTLMYCTGKDPFSNNKIFIEKETSRMEKQKKVIINNKKH